MSPQIDPISCAEVLSQFQDAVTYRFAITKISRLNPLQPNPDLGLRSLVTERLKPLSDWLMAIDHLVSKNFDHGRIVAYKLHACNGYAARTLHLPAFVTNGNVVNYKNRTQITKSLKPSQRGVSLA